MLFKQTVKKEKVKEEYIKRIRNFLEIKSNQKNKYLISLPGDVLWKVLKVAHG